ncbi:rod shape-determining protein RodA [Candidatus Falkowbacteria bacterium]|nr:rod shape-determining protein RodA [Candidatus Falkowbacteria bacterium]
MNRIFLYLKNFDWIIFSSVLLLACFGLVEIYSIALGNDAADFLNFQKQILFIFSGVALLFIFSFIDFHTLKNWSIYIYLGTLGVLGAVLLWGVNIRGSRAWFSIAGFNIQPSEFAKIVLIIFLAKFFSSRATKNRPLKQLVLSGVGAMGIAIFVFLQPDFGSALLLLSIWLLMLIITGFSKKYFIILGIILLAGSMILWNFSFKDYQKQRILTFLNPTADALDQGYNVSQAMIAVGSGQLTGRGLGFGSQSQLKFLPEAQNDFIFAVISEELGLLGCLSVILLYTAFFFRSIAVIKKINSDFGIFFILGALGLIFIEMFINISMNIGILPVVGISLPFISYGGSSIISSFILVGIMENIIIRSKINY